MFLFKEFFLLSTNADEVCEGESSCYPGVLLQAQGMERNV